MKIAFVVSCMAIMSQAVKVELNTQWLDAPVIPSAPVVVAPAPPAPPVNTINKKGQVETPEVTAANATKKATKIIADATAAANAVKSTANDPSTKAANKKK